MARITRRTGQVEEKGETLSEFSRRLTRERLQERGITASESESPTFKKKFGVVSMDGGFGLSSDTTVTTKDIPQEETGPRISIFKRETERKALREISGPRIEILKKGEKARTRLDILSAKAKAQQQQQKKLTFFEKRIKQVGTIAKSSQEREIKSIQKKLKKIEEKPGGVLKFQKQRDKARLEKELKDLQTDTGFTPFLRKQAVEGGIGVILAVKDIKTIVTETKETVKGIGRALKTPLKTSKLIIKEFKERPSRTIANFITFNAVLGVGGKVLKNNPVARVIQEEKFIRTQPKVVQAEVRAVLQANRIQEKIIPIKTKDIKTVSFSDVANLNQAQAKALLKAQKETGGVLFGSKASRILTEGKTKIPKDIDLAVKDIDKFNSAFLKNLPKSERTKLKIKAQKIVNKATGETIADVKPLSRLRPDVNILTGKAKLPIAGFKTKIKIDLKKGSFLPKLEKQLSQGILEVPTQKTVKVGDIKLISFGEQTTRKGLGTLQVLLEKNTRRAKDPVAFIESLKIQSKTIKDKGGFLNKRKSALLDKNINILENKFIKRKGPTKARAKAKPKKKAKPKEKIGVGPRKKRIDFEKFGPRISKVRKKKKPSKVLSKIPKKKPTKLSIIPSRLPKRPSKVPSRIPKKKPSVLPKISKIPSRIPSKIPKRPSKIPSKTPSILPLSKISSIPSSVPSKIPSKTPSKIPSKIPKKRKKGKGIFKLKISKKKERKKDKRKGFNVLGKTIKKKKFVRLNKVPLTEIKAKNLGSFLVDNSLSRTFKIKATNKKARKPVLNVSANYWKNNKKKFREFKIRKGKKIPTKNKFIERKTRLLDTKAEVKKITLLKQRSNLIKKSKKRKRSRKR